MTQRATEGIRAACLKNERKAQAGLKKLKLGNRTYLKHVTTSPLTMLWPESPPRNSS